MISSNASISSLGLLFYIYFVLKFGICSELSIERLIEVADGNWSTEFDQNVEINEDIESNEGSCSFLEFKDINEEPQHQSLICLSNQSLHQDNENYKFLANFVEKFKELLKQNNVNESYIERNREAVFFVGNTGSGKSTTVQILTGNKLYSKEVVPGTDNYIIVDANEKISTNTIISQTLFPEFFVDNETNYVIYDCPGFRDTRSEIHEIVTTYSMRKALQSTSKFKIAIVVTHAALVPGNFRANFLDALKHVSEMFRDEDRYKNSFYLIATKVENKLKLVKGHYTLESDENIIRTIRYFLLEMKESLSNGKILTNSITERGKLIQIIDTLLEKEENVTNHRISIIRRPMEEGPLINNNIIQNEKNKIRKMLLNDKNMVTAKGSDFGFPISDEAILYLNELFQKMNSYMSVTSKEIGENIVKHFVKVIDSNLEVDVAIKQIQFILNDFKNLSTSIEESENPEEFIKVIHNFSNKNKLQLHCLYNDSDLFVLHKYLLYLNNYTESAKYSPSSWEISENEISLPINNKLVGYDFLMHMFELLTSYDIQSKRDNVSLSLQKGETELNLGKENFNNVLELFNLKIRYRSMVIDDVLIGKLNNILNLTLKSQLNVICNEDTVILSDYIILLSRINYNDIYKSCSNVKEIVLIASHTIFFDENLTDDWFKGKMFTIIAPIWEVIGVRTISVDGMSGGGKLTKANIGEIGKQGRNGEPGGSFTGVGMIFNNGGNLVITANGGNGQDGQDGGDGENGKNGKNGTEGGSEKYVDKHRWIFIVFNRVTNEYIAPGSPGTPGGNSGAGGKGGVGGTKGSVSLYNIGKNNHEIKIRIYDGEVGKNGNNGLPGIGGSGGCDKRILIKRNYIFFIPVPSWTETEYVNCNTDPVTNGRVEHNFWSLFFDNSPSTTVPQMINSICSKCKVCANINIFQELSKNYFYRQMSDGVTKDFINSMKSYNNFK